MIKGLVVNVLVALSILVLPRVDICAKNQKLHAKTRCLG
jgi:hypothetical protein